MTWTTPGQWVSTGDDRTPPVLTLVGGDVIINSGDEYIELGYSATDDVDGEITRRVIATVPNLVSSGSKLVTYDAFDIRGNTTTETRGVLVTVGDIDLFVINAIAETVFTVESGDDEVLSVFPNRANRSPFKFKPVEAFAGINLLDGYFDFDNNLVYKVEILAAGEMIDSTNNHVAWEGNEIFAELSALGLQSRTASIRVVVYVGTDTKGIIFCGDGLDAEIFALFQSPAIRC